MFDVSQPLAPPKNPTDKVYAFIIGKIQSREWAANGKIMTENELCAALGVSRVAVREAVERLVAIGLLIKKQGSGTFVSSPKADSCFNSLFPMILLDAQGTSQLLEFRAGFESNNVKLFMKHHEPADIVALEDNYARMRNTPPTDSRASGNLDCEFHQLIAAGTKNPFVVKISRILNGILLFHQVNLYQVADLENAHRYHQDIIRHIKSGDGKVAAALMRRHIKISALAFQRHQTAGGQANPRIA